MSTTQPVAIGDYLCHYCTLPGEKTGVGKGIGPCERGCGRRTARVLASAPPDEKAKPGLRRVTVRG